MAGTDITHDGVVKRVSGSFFRGATMNIYPNDSSLDKSFALAQYLTRGWMPKEPYISKSAPIVAFGSCFAGNISKYLHKRGFNVLTRKDNKAYVTRMGDGMVHTHAIRQQFEWAWLNKTPSQDLWHGYEAEEFGYTESAHADTLRLFNEAEVFIITLGLSEIWYDEPTGEVFWRAIPKEKYDASRHKFRVATHAETLANIRAIHSLIRTYRPNATVVFTVSPIPLAATFRPVTAIAANAVSKATIRSAVDEFYQEASPNDDRLFYFPSYDIVMHAFNHQWNADRRHVYAHVLAFNMKIFEHFFCTSDLPQEKLEMSFRKAQRLDKKIGESGHGAVAGTFGEDEEARQARRKATGQRRRALRRAARINERKMHRKKVGSPDASSPVVTP